MQQENPYEIYADQYESWFSENQYLFASEVAAIRTFMPSFKKGIEIGVGTGLFAQALGISEGVEPSKAMRLKAAAKGIQVFDASVENLPFKNAIYDFALMVTVDCFLKDLDQAYRELNRILKKNGSLIVAFLDNDSPLGIIYDQKKKENLFYASATFHTANQMNKILQHSGFHIVESCQTIFSLENKTQDVRKGTGEGVFAVIHAIKP
jgi:SAM-dependent methyltransferase